MRALRRPMVKRFAPWLARLALFAILFQISAIDHHTHVEDVVGVTGSSQHAMHCHGSVGTCVSGAIEQPSILTQTILLPQTPALAVLSDVGDATIPSDAHIELSPEPPQHTA
jgi:hypothetical protein